MTAVGANNYSNIRKLKQERGNKVSSIPREQRLTYVIFMNSQGRKDVSEIASIASRRLRVKKSVALNRVNSMIRNGALRRV